VAEGARLESVYAGNRIEGSNPSPSATVILHCEIHRLGQLAMQFEIELPALLCGVCDDLLDQAAQSSRRFVAGRSPYALAAFVKRPQADAQIGANEQVGSLAGLFKGLGSYERPPC
jgi:hypothetical protein